MKTALYLFVVIAAFALVEESAAGLLGGLTDFLTDTLDTTLTGVGKITKDSIQDLTGTLDALDKQVKHKGTEVKKNVKSKVKETTDKLKQQLQKLKAELTVLHDQVTADLDHIFSSQEGNWKNLKKETNKKFKDIIDKNLDKAKSNSKLEDIKKGIKSDLKKLANTTADEVKCDENEKKEFAKEFNNKMEDNVDKWYKKADQ